MPTNDDGKTEDAARFLRRLAPDQALTFLTLGEPTPGRKHTRVLHGNFAKHEAHLVSLNEGGAGVFVMVNRGDGRGRKKENVQSVRAVFVDLDGAPLDPVEKCAVKPHMIVQTSPGKYHAYWLVTGCTLEMFTPVQVALAKRFNGDFNVKDLPRVMRLPGFWHRKAAPFRSKILDERHEVAVNITELVDKLSLTLQPASDRMSTEVVVAPPHPIEEGQRNNTLFGLARGFHSKGFSQAEGLNRIKKVNLRYCEPPLATSELDAIVASAYGYANTGFIMLPHEVYDSLEWKQLPHGARSIVLAAMRRFNGSNNGNIALTALEFKGEPGLSENTFYRHRDHAVKAGFLVVEKKRRYVSRGKYINLDLFRIPWIRNRKKDGAK